MRRSLCLWTCGTIAEQLVRDGIVESISPQTVQRMLAGHKLKPWRVHYWINPKKPRDEAFIEQVQNLADLYTRDLGAHEVVLCVDEKTSIQPRPRLAPTRPARSERPVQVEHRYQRCGALNLFAAFDTRSGKVIGKCYPRKRQAEFIDFLAHIDAVLPEAVTTIHIASDNLSTHHGKQVLAWLATHPRFVFHFTPVGCSWMNQVEQWFSILQRMRLRLPDCPDKAELADRIARFIDDEWNAKAHPFEWKTTSFTKVLAKAEAEIAARNKAA